MGHFVVAFFDAERWPFAKRAVSSGVSGLCTIVASGVKDTLVPGHCAESAKVGLEEYRGLCGGIVSLSRIR